jgi:hypothetical protein
MSDQDEKEGLAIFVEDEYSPLDHICHQAQKIAKLKMLTALSDVDICKRLRVTKEKFKNIVKDEHFQNYMKQLQHQLDEEDFAKKIKAQEDYFRDRMFDEMASRFDMPDAENDLPADASIEERGAYLKRFAYYADFKEIAKVWDASHRRTGINSSKAAPQDFSETELIQRVQERRVKLVTRRQRMQELLTENGLDYNAMMSEDSDIGYSQHNDILAPSSVASVDEITVTMEEYSIRKK